VTSDSSFSSQSWTVHKFGGTSVANADRYRAVGQILRDQPPGRLGVVVSAMSGVTNELLEIVALAARRDESYSSRIQALGTKHLSVIANLLSAGEAGPLTAVFERDLAELKDLLRGVYLARSASDRTSELISGYGEIWSAQLLSGHLRSLGLKSTWLDARRVLVTEPSALSPVVDWEVSKKKLDAWLAENNVPYLVITGFIASTKDELATTLGRNGSDYSASIFGALMEAAEIHIWTDVDGVLSADPRLVPEAVVLRELSYSEATELAYFGAKVVHPSTMAPAIRGRIPIWIRNTFNAKFPGTRIHAAPDPNAPGITPVKGFATIDKLALVNVEGTGMIGVPGVAHRVFGALREVGVSVVMISQASSENSICFVVPEAQAELARSTVERAFFAELHHGHIQAVSVTAACSALSVVGDNMAKHPGISGKFFHALGKAGVNIRAIAQGSSERNISTVIDGKDAARGLRAVHSAFYLSSQTISIGVIGAGLIGGTFLEQLGREVERLKREAKLDLRVRGILTSRKMLLGDPHLPLVDWRERLASSGTAPNLEAFVSHIRADHLPHAALIDATASRELPKHYVPWLRRGLHLITPNKKGSSGKLAAYRELKLAAKSVNRHYLYSTTVGAGLPILSTLRDLVQTGDRVHRVEGILSGTLSYLFNSYERDRKFSEIVREARRLGFTEPDPRDDLSGADVARKLVILAREMGLDLEVEDIEVQSLVPSGMDGLSVDEFLSKLSAHDAEMEKLRADAEKKQAVLRYVGTIEADGKAHVDLRPFPRSHPFASLSASDNIVMFQSARYAAQSLVVRGPGAGAEVTAAGVFADLLRLAQYLGEAP